MTFRGWVTAVRIRAPAVPSHRRAEPHPMKLPTLMKMKIAQKLPLAMIGSALVVGVGIGVAAYIIGLQTVDQQRVLRMQTSVAAGAEQVRGFVASVSQDVANFAKRTDTVTQI